MAPTREFTREVGVEDTWSKGWAEAGSEVRLCTMVPLSPTTLSGWMWVQGRWPLCTCGCVERGMHPLPPPCRRCNRRRCNRRRRCSCN